MNRKNGIIALLFLIGLMGLLAVLVNQPKTVAPSPGSNPPPVVEAVQTNAPVTNVIAELAPTNPPVVQATSLPVETNPPEAPETNLPPPAPILSAADTNSAPTNAITNAVPETVITPNTTAPSRAAMRSIMGDFLSDSFTNDLTDNQEFFYRFRAGYEHASLGGGRDTWMAGVKFYYRPQSWRDELKEGTNFLGAALVPDALAEIDHSAIPYTPAGGKPTTAGGIRLNAGFYWPWLNWRPGATTNGSPGKIHFTLGPTVAGGLEETFSSADSDVHWTRYGGARLAANPDAFIEYSVGQSGGLPGLRRQVLAEFPLYRKTGSDFRYVVRGLWNSSSSQNNDFFEAAVMVEFPFEALEHPSSFRDLLPFGK
jgi:hypothetical protein